MTALVAVTVTWTENVAPLSAVGRWEGGVDIDRYVLGRVGIIGIITRSKEILCCG